MRCTPTVTASLCWALAISNAPAQERRLDQLVETQVERLLHDETDVVAIETAAEELARLGTAAVLRLVERWLEELERSTPAARWGGMPIASRLHPGIRRGILAAGPGGELAARRLLHEVQSPRWRTLMPALNALADVGPWYPALRDALARVPNLTPEDIQRLAPAETPMQRVRYLHAFQESAWHRLRIRTAVHPRAENKVLIDLVWEGNATEIEFAAQILSLRGSTARQAAPALANAVERALDDQVPLEPLITVGGSCLVHRAAVDALAAVAPEDRVSIEAHRARLSPALYPSSVRCEAARALGRFGPRAACAVPELLEVRDSWDDDTLMLEAVTALGQIGPAASSAITMLEELRDEVFWNDELVTGAERALAAIRGR